MPRSIIAFSLATVVTAGPDHPRTGTTTVPKEEKPMLRKMLPMILAGAVLVAPLTAWAESEMDHAALAAQYEQEAKDARAKVQLHKDMEKQYGGVKVTNPKSGLPNLNTMKNHCRRLISEYTEVANDADALAKEHRAAAAAH